MGICTDGPDVSLGRASTTNEQGDEEEGEGEERMSVEKLKAAIEVRVGGVLGEVRKELKESIGVVEKGRGGESERELLMDDLERM
jgi:hypothetical protein